MRTCQGAFARRSSQVLPRLQLSMDTCASVHACKAQCFEQCRTWAHPGDTVYLSGRVPGRVWQTTGQAIELRRVALESSAIAKPHLGQRHEDTVSAKLH